MRKVLIIPIIVIAVIILGFSFIPMLEKYQLYSFDQRVDRELGEGQKFTDATGKRCLMSETIAGDKCPIGSKGYNPDTGVYDTGVSGMAQLNAKLGGYSDPYDPSSFDRIDAMLGIPQQKPVVLESWLDNHRGHLKQFIIDGDCNQIKEFYLGIEKHVKSSTQRESQIEMYNQGIKEYREAYQEFCE